MVAAAETQPPQAQSGQSPNSKETSPNKAPVLSEDELKEKAFASVAAGKRHLLVADIPLAVSTLGDAAEQLAKIFGDTAAECAEVYFYYGKALLEMARLENGVLGNALDGVPEGEDAETSQVEDPEKMTEEEKEDVEEKVEEALEENFDKHDKIAKIHNGEADEEDESPESEDAATEDEVSADAETEKPDNAECDVENGGDKETEDKESEDEDPSNLQLAWEMLELAKVLYTKKAETQKDKELEQRICETYMVLGEVSLENENYSQAVEDLSICLKKRTESLPSDSRCIAETHYQLGIAQGFASLWKEAVVSLEEAIKVLETRITNLKAEKESVDESKKDDSTYTREKEVAELEALIPEIKEKITDTNEMEQESLRKVKEALGVSSGSGSSSSSEAKPVASIAIKRKAEDSKEDGDSKKKKEDEPVKSA